MIFNNKKKLLLPAGGLFLGLAVLALWFFWDWRPVPVRLPDPSGFAPAPAVEEGANYDVIVVGGQPEGVAAAISAACYGGKVLLVEERDGLGGLFTYGWLNFIDMNRGPRYELLTRGTFLEFYRRVGGSNFDIARGKQVLAEMAEDYPNLSVSLNTVFKEPIMAGSKIAGIVVLKDDREISLYGKRIIDATQDADVAAAAGVPYTVGAEDLGEEKRYQAATLVYHLGNVDWQALKNAVNRKLIAGTKISNRAAWGFAGIAKEYKPSSERLRLRGFNIARQDDGTVLINALQIFGVDGLSKSSREEAMELARRELPAITDFMREKLPGFEQVELLGGAPELYIRETRHTKALYQLTLNDVVFNRFFPDTVALGSYPVDVQATTPHDSGFVYGDPKAYGIPLRSLIPSDVEDLLVVGRAAGYSHLAAGSARVVPIGMATGDAAGISAVYSIEKDKSFQQIALSPADMSAVQKMIRNRGGYLKDYRFKNDLEDHWAFAELQYVNELGLVVAGYDNNWKLKEPVRGITFYYMTANGLKRGPRRGDLVEAYDAVLKYPYLGLEYVSREKAARLLLTYLGEDHGKLGPEEAVNRAGERGLLPLEITGGEPGEVITGEEAYYATAKLCAIVETTKIGLLTGQAVDKFYGLALQEMEAMWRIMIMGVSAGSCLYLQDST